MILDSILTLRKRDFATEQKTDAERKESVSRSLAKSISWRIVGTIDTIIVSYFITGTIQLAVSIGAVEVLTKLLIYYVHERIWLKIKLK